MSSEEKQRQLSKQAQNEREAREVSTRNLTNILKAKFSDAIATVEMQSAAPSEVGLPGGIAAYIPHINHVNSMRAMAQNQILPPTPTPSVHYSPQRTKPYSPQRSHNPSFSQTGNHNFVKIEEKSPVRFKNIENPQNHDDSLPAWAKSANSPSNDFSKISPIEKPHRNPSQDTDITTFADLPVPIRVSGVPKISLTSTQEINRTSIPEAHNLGKPKLVSSLIADQNNSPFKESNLRDTNFKEPELPSVKVLSSPKTSRKSVRRNILKSHSNSKSTSKNDSFGVDNAENAVEMSLLSNDSVRTKDLSVYLQKLLDGDKKYSKVNSFDDISEAIESSHRLVKSTQSSPRKSKKLHIVE